MLRRDANPKQGLTKWQEPFGSRFSAPRRGEVQGCAEIIRPSPPNMNGKQGPFEFMAEPASPSAMIDREPRQARKGAAAAVDSGAGVWLAGDAACFSRAGAAPISAELLHA